MKAAAVVLHLLGPGIANTFDKLPKPESNTEPQMMMMIGAYGRRNSKSYLAPITSRCT